jgi:hypothetical protein
MLRGMDLRFSGEIWHWRGPAPFYFVTVPEEQCVTLRDWAHASYGWGMVPVTAKIGDTVWETSLWPKDGAFIVPLKDRIRRSEDLDEGLTVEVELDLRTEARKETD